MIDGTFHFLQIVVEMKEIEECSMGQKCERRND